MARPAEANEPTSTTTSTDNRLNCEGENGGDTERPHKRQRKQRPCYSCEECRRLKMKCDRQVPCSNCIRRRRAEVCNGPTNTHISSRPAHNLNQPCLSNHHDRDDSKQRSTQSAPAHSTNRFNPSIESTERELQPMSEQEDHLDIESAHLFPHETPISVSNSAGDLSKSRPASLLGGENLNVLSNSLEESTVLPSTLISSPPGVEDNIPTFSGGRSNNTLQGGDNVEQLGSYGTLLIGNDGRSKYLGPTAGSEWLKDSETQDALETPLITRAPTPNLPRHLDHSQNPLPILGNGPIAFPFNTSPARISTRDLLSQLPPREEAWTLAKSYYRYCAWHHDVAPRTQFELTFNRVYSLAERNVTASRVDPQEIALVFIIMAQGTIFNIEMPYYDSSAEEWLHLSERALVKGEFLSNNTVAGVQTLHLMAHLHLHLDKGRRGDNAWPLWGLVMRLIQAMGMHRDGTRWNLPQDVVEERRKVFWELNCADTFQAHCFSRPCAINPEHCDTEFPSQSANLHDEKTYSTLRYELSQLSSEILNMAMKVQKPPYSDVMDLNIRLCEFERNIPFPLRSRAALLAMPSRFPQTDEALAASPEPSRRSIIKSFQQMNLALNISETIINLHRPYYAKALHDDVGDRLNSIYAPSFLTVIERCALIINIVIDIHIRFPAVSNRQWNLWFHVFGCALCLGTLILRDPGNSMSSYVLTQIDAAIDLFTSLIQHGAGTPRYRRNLEWLIKLRARAFSKMAAASATDDADNHSEDFRRTRMSEGVEDSEDVELLGWRTRLINRAGQARQTIRTIHHPATPTGSHITGSADSPRGNMNLRDTQGRLRAIQGMSSNLPPTLTAPDVTDDLLHGFWDPMLLQDILGYDHTNHFTATGSTWWEGTSTTLDVS